MATLNAFTAYGADEDDEEGVATLTEPPLGWQWATWPSNVRTAVTTLVTLVLILVGLIFFVRWADKDLSKKLQTQSDIKTQAQTKLKNSDQERSDIDKYLPLLRQLESKGIFGEEKRLEWIEQLRLIEKRWAGVKLQYNIAAQNPMREPDPVPGQAAIGSAVPQGQSGAPVLLPNGEPAQSFGAFQTDMKLTLKVLHEGDVLAIVEELKAAKLGRFTIKQCSFKRLGSQSSMPNTPNAAFTIGTPLDAECVLTWVSMKAYTPS